MKVRDNTLIIYVVGDNGPSAEGSLSGTLNKASLDYRQRLQELFFPEGIAFDGIRFNRTAVTALLFRYLEPVERAESNMASPPGFEPGFQP